MAKLQSYRSSMTAMKNVFDSYKFEGQLLEYLKNTPFWLLMEPFINKTYPEKYMRKIDIQIRRLIENYIKEEEGWVFGKKILKPTKADIQVCLGIRCGNREMDLNDKARPSSRLESCFGPGAYLTSSMIRTAIDEKMKIEKKTNLEYYDITKFFCLLVLSTFLLPSSQNYVPWAWLKYVDQIAILGKYDIAGAVLSYLKESLKTMKGPDTCKGCVPFLVIFFCEHTTLVKPSEEKKFPRFLKWSFPEICESFKDIKFDSIKPDQVTVQISPIN